MHTYFLSLTLEKVQKYIVGQICIQWYACIHVFVKNIDAMYHRHLPPLSSPPSQSLPYVTHMWIETQLKINGMYI